MKNMSIIYVKGPSLQRQRKEAIKVAKEIGYSKEVVEKLEKAMGYYEIERILVDARKRWDVYPERWTQRGKYTGKEPYYEEVERWD